MMPVAKKKGELEKEGSKCAPDCKTTDEVERMRSLMDDMVLEDSRLNKGETKNDSEKLMAVNGPTATAQQVAEGGTKEYNNEDGDAVQDGVITKAGDGDGHEESSEVSISDAAVGAAMSTDTFVMPLASGLSGEEFRDKLLEWKRQLMASKMEELGKTCLSFGEFEAKLQEWEGKLNVAIGCAT